MHKSKPNGSPTVHLLQPLLKLLAKRWKGVTVSVILVVGTIGFTQIELTGGERLNVIESFYETLRLFVLGASGMPSDGPKVWLGIMWFLYLLAPALTATFLVESLRTIKQQGKRGRVSFVSVVLPWARFTDFRCLAAGGLEGATSIQARGVSP